MGEKQKPNSIKLFTEQKILQYEISVCPRDQKLKKIFHCYANGSMAQCVHTDFTSSVLFNMHTYNIKGFCFS